jgi:ribosomal protein S18 acetylase RimI-like enzyme
MAVRYKKIESVDYPFLREMLYEAIFVPEGEEPFPTSIVDLPEISKYIDNWDENLDFGFIVLHHDKPVGAIWCRLFSEEHKGYGFVDKDIPEVSMALKKEYQNRGLGSELMVQTFTLAKEKDYKYLSLSVDKRNRAFEFYKRMGFKIVDEVGTAYTMKRVI